jgi:hypothetical protein
MAIHWQNELQSVGVNKSEGVNTKLTANKTQNQQCTKKIIFAAHSVSHMSCFISFRSVAFDLFSRRFWKHVSLQAFETKYETLHLTVELKPQNVRDDDDAAANNTTTTQFNAPHIAQVNYAVMVPEIKGVFSKILTGQYY